MTAPQYYQPPGTPPGYAPQYAPAPQGYAPPQPQYAPPAPQYAPQPQQAPPAPGYGGANPQGHDGFRAPDPQQSNVIRPRLLDFGRDGRLVLISPIKIERGVPNNLGKPGEVQDRMTADVVVLDGAPFGFGGAPEKGKPHTHTAQTPYESVGMWISSAPLISQCERRVGESVLGRLGVKNLPNGNTAYKLDDPNEQDMALARQYLVDKQAGKIAPPQQIPASQPYAGPPPQQAPQAPPAPQYMTAPAPLPQYAPAPQAPQQQYAPPPPPPAAVVDIDTCPSNIDPAWWAQQPPEVRMLHAGQAQSRPGV